ncbi:hypothetical protein ID0186_04040 [Helicobacter pylori]
MLSSNDLFMVVLGAILLVLVCLVGYLYLKEKEFYHKMRRLEKTFFGVARDKDFLEITRMHALDIKRYDSFIVDSERKGLKL